MFSSALAVSLARLLTDAVDAQREEVLELALGCEAPVYLFVDVLL